MSETYSTLGEEISLRRIWEASARGHSPDLANLVEEFFARVQKRGGCRELAALGLHWALHTWHEVNCDDPTCRHHEKRAGKPAA